MNPTKIKAIDKTSVHRICSGQVVLNLAVAVKELLENSLDAGATVINVRLKEYGSELLEVTDNGTGVHPDNFQGLTLKHHTSKLKDFSDLESVCTFGFRGEALSSLCALSKVTISTKHESQSVGACLTFEHTGAIASSNNIPRQVGTTVALANLFSTLPVRQKEFHRNLKKDFNKMTQLLYAYCLVSTGVKITCTNQTSKGTKTTFVSTVGCPTVKENISSVFGPKQLGSLLELKTVRPSEEVLEELKLDPGVADVFKLVGFISSCAHGSGRPASDRQFYYINSRPCEPSKVMKAVNEVYHQYNVNQVPFVFMNVHVERTFVDVNVTPDKRQVFLDQEKLLIATVKASLTELYEKIPSTFVVNSLKRPLSVTQISSSEVDNKPSLAKFCQFRHKSDQKQDSPQSKQSAVMHKAKQMKLDSHFNSSVNKNEISKKNISIFSSFQSNYLETDKVKINSCDTSIDCDRTVDKNSSECSNMSKSKPHTKIAPQNQSLLSLEFENVVKSTECVQSMESSDENVKTLENGDNLPMLTNEFRNERPDKLETVNNEFIESQTYAENDEEQGKIICSNEQNYVNNQIDIENDERKEKIPDEETSDCETLEINSIIYDDSLDKEQSIKTDCEDQIPDRKIVKIHLTIDMLKNSAASRKEFESSRVESPLIKFRSMIDPTKNSEAEQELSTEISKDKFSKMEIIGQFNLGFIITKLDSDLFIVDQHATDEKYNFETLQLTTTLSNQKLVVPQNLELTAANECILLENLDVFKKNGFDFIITENEVSSKKVKLSAIPMSKNWVFGKQDVDELLFMLQDVSPGTMCRPSRVKAMFASRACRMSVMIGSHLSRKDMRRLVDHMGQIEQPWNCPHGRPTMRHLINLQLTE